MEKICMSQKRIDEIRAICKEHGNDPGELINILHTVQGKLGYLPKEVQELIAMELGIPAAKVYGVVTFYSFFTMKPKGKYPISVCMGTACYVAVRRRCSTNSSANWASRWAKRPPTASSRSIRCAAWVPAVSLRS